MPRSPGLLLAVLLAGACADAVPPFSADAADASAQLAAWGDADADGIDDGVEWELANRFAPLMYMPNLISRVEAGAGVAGDWTWPATVEWYLPRVRMRIHHNNCSDHQLLNVGQVTPANLISQVHMRYTRGLFGCSHVTPYQYSNRDYLGDDHYFLQALDDDAVHPGMGQPSQWKTYFHAYPNNLGGVTIQYWFFYAYNDGFSIQNHEGDWEEVEVKLDAAQNPVAVLFSFHGDLQSYAPGDVSWHGGTHPRVWVADGSHANFRSEDACNTSMREAGMKLFGVVVNRSCWTNDSQRWFTWSGGRGTAPGIQGAGLVNLGSKRYPAPGQQWIQYSAAWGEKGQSKDTSGPQGPAYKAEWWRDASAGYLGYVSGGGGGGGGGGDCSGDDPMLQQALALPVC